MTLIDYSLTWFENLKNDKSIICWITSRDGIILFCNSGFAGLFQKQPKDVIGEHLESVFPPDVVQKYFENNEYVIGSGKQIVDYEPAPLPDGNLGTYKVTKFPIEVINEKGEKEMAAGGYAIDVTDLMEKDSQLKDLKERNRIACENAKVGIWEWDFNTEELIWDQVMYELYGIDCSSKVSVFQHWLDSVHPKDIEEAEKTLYISIETKTTFDQEFRIITPDGITKYIRSQAETICDEQGKPLKMIGINRDVSKEKQLLSTLIHTEKLNTLGLFTSKLSHEIKNPLLIASLSLGRLKNFIGESKGAKELGYLEQAVSRVDRLTNIFREFSHSNTSYHVEDLNLSDMIERNLSFMSMLFDESFSICVDVEKSINVKATRDGLDQILLNIFSNSIKAMKGYPNKKINISAFEEGKYVIAEITDDGPGFPNSILENFGKAFQTTSRKQEGTGLGLLLTKEIMEALGGKAFISNTEDAGACFRLTFKK